MASDELVDPDPNNPGTPSNLGVFLGAFATFLVAVLLTFGVQVALHEPDPPRTIAVMVASRDLNPGVVIQESDIYGMKVPLLQIPEDVYLRPEHVVGRVAKERILANEFLRGQRLSQPLNGVGLNATIPRGMRAISLDVGREQALSGYITATSLVDVLVTLPAQAGADGQVIREVLAGVFVLEVKSAATAHPEGGPTVTILVNEEQAERLAEAEAVGKVSLTLAGG